MNRLALLNGKGLHHRLSTDCLSIRIVACPVLSLYSFTIDLKVGIAVVPFFNFDLNGYVVSKSIAKYKFKVQVFFINT